MNNQTHEKEKGVLQFPGLKFQKGGLQSGKNGNPKPGEPRSGTKGNPKPGEPKSGTNDVN